MNSAPCGYLSHHLSLDDLAALALPHRCGRMGYCGRFSQSAMSAVLSRVSSYLRRWAGSKYRRLHPDGRFPRWWTGLLDRQRRHFAHRRQVPFCARPVCLEEPGEGTRRRGLPARTVARGRERDAPPITTARELTDASEGASPTVGVPIVRRLVRILWQATGTTRPRQNR
jgi:hypothetical protein